MFSLASNKTRKRWKGQREGKRKAVFVDGRKYCRRFNLSLLFTKVKMILKCDEEREAGRGDLEGTLRGAIFSAFWGKN